MNNGFYGISKIQDDVPLDDFRKEKYPDIKNWKNNSVRSIFWSYTPRKYSYDTENIMAFKFKSKEVTQKYFELFQNTLKQLKEHYGLTLDRLNHDLDEFIKDNGTF